MDLSVERLLARPTQRRAELHRALRFSGQRIAAVEKGIPGAGAGLLAMRDRNAIAYGDDERTLGLIDEKDRPTVRRYLMPRVLPPREQVALVDEIAAAVQSELVSVQYGPAAVQWCSDALLAAIAERS